MLKERQAFPTGPIIRKIGEYSDIDLKPETVYRLSKARVVYANYTLLQHDFPQLRNAALEQSHPDLQKKKGTAKQSEIRKILDDWLLSHAAFISENQSRQCVTNTPIPTSIETVIAYRLPGHGRALVYSVQENARRFSSQQPDYKINDTEGLIDVKGTGVGPNAQPTTHRHSNGLLSLEYALREVLFQHMINNIFVHAGSSYSTLPNYGVLDTGFDCILRNKLTEPAGMLVRRAHRRPAWLPAPWWREELPKHGAYAVKTIFEIEMLLRRYGITSALPKYTFEITDQTTIVLKCAERIIRSFTVPEFSWPQERLRFEDRKAHYMLVNVQTTESLFLNGPVQLVDLEHYRVCEHFDTPLVSMLASGMQPAQIIMPDSTYFAQPDEKICLPYELWGKTGEIWGHQWPAGAEPPWENDNADLLINWLVQAFRKREITGDQLCMQLTKYLQTATLKWR